MPDNKKEFTRKEFYELVWSKPLTTLAKEFAYSDNGLRKICIKHDIPLPKSGHWSKIKFNKKVKKEKLSKGDDSVKIELYIRKKGQESINHPNSERAKILHEIKSNKELPLIVPDRLSKPHKFTLTTRDYHKKLKVRNKSRNWSMKIDDTNVLSISVSDNLFPRALRFMDTLIKVMIKRGYSITTSNHTEIVVYDQSYDIRLTEKNRRVKRETNTSWDEFDLVPTGNLCLKLDRTYPIKEWSDTKTTIIENKLADILVWIEHRAKQDRERQIEHAIWRKQQDIIEAKRKELQKRKDKEFDKFNQLFDTATRWHKTQYLRGFIKEYENYLTDNNQLDEDKKQYIDWAKEKADWLDPFIEKQDSLLYEIDRDSLNKKQKQF